ncbi:kynureninase [Paracoccaceae bacterium]|nr:kynureninase [Paracoccaceae bacterium]
MPDLPSREDAIALDRADPFAAKRDAFLLEDDVIYLCGNSLGPMPKSLLTDMDVTLREDWAKGLITSQNKAGWFMMTDTLGDRLGAMLGADDGEIVVSDATGLNIYKTLHAAISMQPGRKSIVCETASFPTDLYMVEGVTSLLTDMTVKMEGREADRIEDLIDEDTAVVLLNQVDYRSGVIRDVKGITELAHKAGALVVSDLCHAAGAIPVDLHDDNVDFSVGCTYKYMNSGPGSPAFLYAAKRHHGKFSQPLKGWQGHNAPFKFELGYRPGAGIRAMLTGSQPTLSAIAVRSALDVFDDVDIAELYEKGKALSVMFISLIEDWCDDYGIGFYSPKDANLRNGQVSLTHENGYPIMQAMIARKVIGDFRQPNVLRFGMAPLYLSYANIWDAAQTLRKIMETDEWKQDRFQVQNLVT